MTDANEAGPSAGIEQDTIQTWVRIVTVVTTWRVCVCKNCISFGYGY